MELTFPVQYVGIQPTLAAWLSTWKKSRPNWKVSNTADNAGITQSQARDTRYRRM